MVVDSTQINTALVGGLVGGAIVIVIIFALVACFVMRKRQSTANEGDSGRAMQHPSADSQSRALHALVSNSNYDRIDVPSHHYSERAVVAAAPTSHYAALEPNEIGA